jgi:site-specific DNA recombinase
MLCTDIQVPVEEADRAFMRAWNFLISHGLRYASSYREMARDGKDELIRYRAREMGRLLDRGRIREVDYELMMRVLSHVEVTDVGRLAVIFLTGTRVTV